MLLPYKAISYSSCQVEPCVENTLAQVEQASKRLLYKSVSSAPPG